MPTGADYGLASSKSDINSAIHMPLNTADTVPDNHVHRNAHTWDVGVTKKPKTCSFWVLSSFRTSYTTWELCNSIEASSETKQTWTRQSGC
jgi:hypothetical protein